MDRSSRFRRRLSRHFSCLAGHSFHSRDILTGGSHGKQNKKVVCTFVSSVPLRCVTSLSSTLEVPRKSHAPTFEDLSCRRIVRRVGRPPPSSLAGLSSGQSFQLDLRGWAFANPRRSADHFHRRTGSGAARRAREPAEEEMRWPGRFSRQTFFTHVRFV